MKIRLSYKSLRVTTLIIANICLCLGIASWPHWTAIFDAVISGFLFSQWIWLHRIAEMQVYCDEMSEIVDQYSILVRGLVERINDNHNNPIDDDNENSDDDEDDMRITVH